ncbi:carboxylesterase, putative [Talaromyces stipitatus ATCC 10500]|uniref:Carboxylesterase, putative n=1 Tax=Talaromyces stipitatus (strain ATCC 10500 / CBS 375.48 / QM 6759 / NRRL 1006) TaxID=441959 RepID=B8LYP3_TALSN|nr:carboxylesterase, putative [Talaromyces stipitatus ATCC 10500]EED23401.1 carboxylesterase, putative [Talaromyces stipitatus ATCC 10500]
MDNLIGSAFVFWLLNTLLLSEASPASSHYLKNQFNSATILFHNDGDWRTHEQTPSAILVNEPATYDHASEICASYNESLLDCDKLSVFANDIAYQVWLGNIDAFDLLWTSCSLTQPSDFHGVLSTAGNALEFPFLCTNTAPFVSQVDTDYSTFPTVKTPIIEGVVFEGLRDHMAYRFLGIPYAKPPVDDLRFQYAQPPEYSNNGTGIIDATAYKPACMQVGSFEGNAQGLNPWGNSEDCLYLEVFTPVLPSGDSPPSKGLKPVMLWIHGGAMINGAGSDSTFDGASLVSRGDAVLVSINYRLNIFGLLTLDDGVVNGNYALSDKIAALQWVKKYIAAFGGDPDNVTIFGQSAGGASVMDLITSPKAKGLFKNAIPQSLGGIVVDQATIASKMIPYIQPECPSSLGAEARLECLRQLSAETLLSISTESWSWSTVIDGVYMVDQPVSLVANAQVNHVNLLIGFMPDEAQSLLSTNISLNMTNLTTGLKVLINQGIINSSQISDISSSGLWDIPQDYTDPYNATVNIGTDGMIICHVLEFIDAATTSAPKSSNAFTSLWVYTHQRAYALSFYSFYDLCTFPVNEPDTPYYRCHSGDLYEVFGTYYIFDQPVRVEEDIYYTNAIQDIWTSFAKTGNPNPDKEYLIIRGYESSLEMFEGFGFEEYDAKKGRGLVNLQWPRVWYSDLPDREHCQLLGINPDKMRFTPIKQQGKHWVYAAKQ